MTDDLGPYRDGSTEPWTANVVAALAAALRPSVIIETGTFKALTTIRLVDAVRTYRNEKDCRVYTVEVDPVRAVAAWDAIRGSEPWNVIGVTGKAEEFLATFEGVADFIFLDDDHTAAHVREEIRLALKILRPGGIICVHDVVGHFGLGEVVKEYGGIVLDFPRMHIAGGLGVIVK